MERPHPVQEKGDVVIRRGIQLHGDHPPARVQLVRQGVDAGVGADGLCPDGGWHGGGAGQRRQRPGGVGNVFRGGAAAAAHNCRTGLGDLGQLAPEIVRRALVGRPPPQHGGISGVGHDGQGFVPQYGQIQAANILQQMVGAGHAVEAHRVHRLQGGGAAEQRLAGKSLPGGPVKCHGERDDQVSVWIAFLQMLRQLGRAGVGGLGFQQEAAHPLGQEQVGLAAVSLPPAQLRPLRRGPEIGEYIGATGFGAVPGNAAGGGDDLRRQLPPALGQIHPGGEGVGFDGAAARVQVCPMEVGDLAGIGEIGQLAPLLGPPRQGCETGPHGPVKQQRAVFLDKRADICHPSTFFAISTDCLASFA